MNLLTKISTPAIDKTDVRRTTGEVKRETMLAI